MIVTAWNNGDHHATGAGYGLKISITDRNRYFHRRWQYIVLELEGQPTTVKINVAKPSFWNNTCHELIYAAVGRWLIEHKLAPWPDRQPPKLVLEPVDGAGRFRLLLKKIYPSPWRSTT